MWNALRTELVYSRPWLLGGLGIATFVSALLIVLTVFVNDSDGVPSFVVGMFPIIAGMVVAFIAQSFRSEERRSRLLMAGPMTPRQLAVILVVLPACLVGLGALFGSLWVAGNFADRRRRSARGRHGSEPRHVLRPVLGLCANGSARAGGYSCASPAESRSRHHRVDSLWRVDPLSGGIPTRLRINLWPDRSLGGHCDGHGRRRGALRGPYRLHPVRGVCGTVHLESAVSQYGQVMVRTRQSKNAMNSKGGTYRRVPSGPEARCFLHRRSELRGILRLATLAQKD